MIIDFGIEDRLEYELIYPLGSRENHSLVSKAPKDVLRTVGDHPFAGRRLFLRFWILTNHPWSNSQKGKERTSPFPFGSEKKAATSSLVTF